MRLVFPDREPRRGPQLGAVFTGSEGKIEINRNKFTTNPRDFIKNPPDPKLAEKWEGDGVVAKGHVENWFDCIRSREKPNADVEIGHRTASISHLIVITRLLGRRLKWDPEKEVFPGDEEANALLDRPRRKGWDLQIHQHSAITIVVIATKILRSIRPTDAFLSHVCHCSQPNRQIDLSVFG